MHVSKGGATSGRVEAEFFFTFRYTEETKERRRSLGPLGFFVNGHKEEEKDEMLYDNITK